MSACALKLKFAFAHYQRVTLSKAGSVWAFYHILHHIHLWAFTLIQNTGKAGTTMELIDRRGVVLIPKEIILEIVFLKTNSKNCAFKTYMLMLWNSNPSADLYPKSRFQCQNPERSSPWKSKSLKSKNLKV
jgi:hypothetical protein